MTTPEERTEDASFTLGMTWHGREQAARPANQFVASLGLPTSTGKADEVYLTFGHVAPPVLTGTPQAMEEQVRALGSLPVETLGRYVLSRARLQELIDVLQRAAVIFDGALGAEVDDTGSTNS
ncbi:hypothetical protein AB0M57_02830 [Streptomyces sp. NPDC051597]|uniref:hypothetical protein n=1 Tax=Streptomyces sp. NPDC051597 TaxID=3155049 RepID=UPI00342D9FDA